MADTKRPRTTSTRRAAASTSARSRAASVAEETAQRSSGHADEAATHGEARSATPPVCPVAFCPICTAVSAVNRATPDVVQHLLAAGQQFLLALQAVVDARAADYAATQADDEAEPRMQRIDIG